jgi:hypothetical protein
MTTLTRNGRIGNVLAERLGMKIIKSEGHDLAGPCIACPSSDAFRLHQQTGVAYCYSCRGKWSPFRVAETVLGDRDQAKSLFAELGLFHPSRNGTGSKSVGDPIADIARQKGVTRDSLKAFGAEAISTTSIQLPAYGPDGEQCTTFTMNVTGGKGRFAKGRKAGLFFPHADGKVRPPRPGEIWHVVEGPKDAAGPLQPRRAARSNRLGQQLARHPRVGPRSQRSEGDGNGRWGGSRGAHSGAEECRKWCRSARIACATDRIGWHRQDGRNENLRRRNSATG